MIFSFDFWIWLIYVDNNRIFFVFSTMFFYFDFNLTKNNNIVVCFDLIKHSNLANFFWNLYYCLHKHQLSAFEYFFELIMFFVYRFARVFMWFLFIFSFVVFNMTLSLSFNNNVVSVDISSALIKKKRHNNLILWSKNEKLKIFFFNWWKKNESWTTKRRYVENIEKWTTTYVIKQ